MSEYITREEVYKIINQDIDKNFSQITNNVLRGTFLSISYIPAADVEPVARAWWECIGNDDDGGFSWTCTNCHCGLDDEEYKNVKEFKRCPNCGAHMVIE